MPSFRRISSKTSSSSSGSGSGPGSGDLKDISKKSSASSDNSLPHTAAFVHPHHFYIPPTIAPQPIRKPASQQNLSKNIQEPFKEPNYTTDTDTSQPHTRNNSLTGSDILSTSPTNSFFFDSQSTKDLPTPPPPPPAHQKQGLNIASHFFSSRKSRISSISRASSPSQSEDDTNSINSKDTNHRTSFFGSGQRNRSNSQPQIVDPPHRLSSYRSISTGDDESSSIFQSPRKSNTTPTHIMSSGAEASTVSLPSTAYEGEISNGITATTSPTANTANTAPTVSTDARSDSVMSTDSSLGYRRDSIATSSQDTTPPGFASIVGSGPPGGAYRKKSDGGLLTPLTPQITNNNSRSGSLSGASTTPSKASSTQQSNATYSNANTPEAMSGNALANYYEQLANRQRADSLAPNNSTLPSAATTLSSNLSTDLNPSSGQTSPKSMPTQPSTASTSIHPLSLSSDNINPTINRSNSFETGATSSSPAPIRVPATRTRASGSVSPLSTSLGTATSVTGLSTATYMSKLTDHLNLESSSSSVFPPRKLSQVSQASVTSSVGSLPGTSSTPRSTIRNGQNPATDVNTNKTIWDMFVKFVSNSRLSDSLIYAATRKEAWLQYSDTGFRNTHIIELWLMMALRFLFQNQLLFSPKALDAVAGSCGKCVLDIQGVFKDHWAWQLAIDYPDAMVYGLKFDPSQTTYSSPPNHEGPSNYIPFVGHSLGQLPFDDNFFDVISAKTLWYLLKSDQWEVVFKELFRIIKPGGVIELLISDYTILNRSPIDHNLWDRYQVGVAARNVESFPSYKCASRLHATGFENINRAMVALPRAWGGQIGQLTDLLSSYYTLSLVKYFSDFQQSEVDAFKYRSKHAVEMHYYEAGSLHLFYATKPLEK